MTLFECINLSAGYHKTPVFFVEQLTINSGEFVGIIGPNGAGKSTFIKILARTVSPMSGTIAYKNNTFQTISHKQYASKVASVLPLEHILPYTVESFVALGRYPHTTFRGFSQRDHEAIQTAMALCDVEPLKNKKLTQLSSGELQRVTIARALAQSTDCILLDEPVSHLDIHHAFAIMDILKRLNETGSTIITILHDINIASEYCSRILGIRSGKIFFDGPPEECITYQNIEALFDCVCLVYNNPISQKPYVYPVPKHCSIK